MAISSVELQGSLPGCGGLAACSCWYKVTLAVCRSEVSTHIQSARTSKWTMSPMLKVVCTILYSSIVLMGKVMTKSLSWPSPPLLPSSLLHVLYSSVSLVPLCCHHLSPWRLVLLNFPQHSFVLQLFSNPLTSHLVPSSLVGNMPQCPHFCGLYAALP